MMSFIRSQPAHTALPVRAGWLALIHLSGFGRDEKGGLGFTLAEEDGWADAGVGISPAECNHNHRS